MINCGVIMTDYHFTTKELDKILSKAKMSPDLRKAVDATKEAMEQGDKELVADLSAVKSFIVSPIDISDKVNHFQEDDEYNEKVLGYSLYDYFDSMHHKYAFMTGTLPSGMLVFGDGKIRERAPSKRKHPIIKLMEEERKAIESGNI